MLKLFHVVIFIAVCVKVFSLPSDIEKCKIEDNDCLTKSANKVLKNYFGGITDMDLDTLDPFFVNEIIVSRKYGAINIKNGDITNIKLRGLASASIERISGFDENYVEIHFKVPKASYTGSYKAKADLMFIPIDTDGTFDMNLFDYHSTIKIKLERYTKNGTKYFKTNGFDAHSTVGSGDIDTTGLNFIINWLLQQAFDFLFKDNIESFIDEYFSEYYEKSINKMLTKVPISELFQSERDREGH